ncbi:trigger factor [Neptunicella marina]|uniref:Trigger factor n=1 Tax=Neptunicella marina TaxID=2125989 RepID=A0A8J6LZU4_9ALTE|nr:trigger factor [Neptunicella marina]MBC3766445.1 trigger factor [Neptunicella marina]
MQVSVETTQGLERRLTITVEAENIDSAVKSRLQQLAKTQRINGFRPGKVPVKVIQKRYGQAVRQEISGEVMQRNFYQAIMQEKLTPAGAPTFELKKDVEGEGIEFVASFEVYPEVKLSGLDTIKVEKPVVKINADDVKGMLETLRKQHATWSEVKRAAKAEDQVTIDFVGSIDGEEFEGGKAEDFTLEMGKGRMIPGFEEGIVGAKAGSEVSVDVTFPEDYHAENLKGKAATFAITVKKVEALNLPKLDDEFAKLFGIEEGGVKELKTEVRKNMDRELTQNLKNRIKEQVLTGLLEANEVELPKALVEQEVDVLRQQAIQRFGGQTGGKTPELPAELFKENAERRVSIGLLLGEVIKQNELKVDSDRVDQMIESAASAYEDPQEVISYYKSNQELMQQMQNVALEDQAIDLILESAQVTEVETPFDDIMNKQA